MNKKYFLIFLAILIIVPQVTFASWWNPVSWFSHWTFHNNNSETETLEKKVSELENKINQLQNIPNTVIPTDDKVTTDVSSADESISVLKEKPKLQSVPVIKPEIKDMSTSEKVSTQTTNDENNVKEGSTLQILNVKNEIFEDRVEVSWNTSKLAESRLILDNGNGKVYESENGLSTEHHVVIKELESSQEYNYKITATTNDKKAYDDYFGSFVAFVKYVAVLGKLDEDCRTIIIKDTAGRLIAGKEITVSGVYQIPGYTNNKPSIKSKTNSLGEVQYCEKSTIYNVSSDGINVSLP